MDAAAAIAPLANVTDRTILLALHFISVNARVAMGRPECLRVHYKNA